MYLLCQKIRKGESRSFYYYNIISDTAGGHAANNVTEV